MTRKERVIYVRCTDADKAQLDRVAATLGPEETLSMWIRTVLRKEAEKRCALLDTVNQTG